MKPKFIASMLCAVSLFLLCSCIHLPSATPDTTDSPSKKMLNASVSIGGKNYPSVDGRGFAENFPTEDVLDEEKRVVKGIDYVLYSGQKRLVSGYSEYAYDENGQVVNRKKYDTLGAFIEECRYTQDSESGKPSEVSVYDENGILSGKTTYTYEKVLCLTEKPFYDMLEKVVSEYDADGNLLGSVEYEYFDTIRSIYPQKATYRDGNGVITKAFDFDESGDYEYLYIYENGEIVETKKIG